MEKTELLRTSRRARLLTDRGIFSRSGRLKKVKNMAVKKVGEKYRCNIGDNEITVTPAG